MHMGEEERLDPMYMSMLLYQYKALEKSLAELASRSKEIEALVRAHKEDTIRSLHAHSQSISDVKTKQYYQGTGLERLDMAVRTLTSSVENARHEASTALATLKSTELKELGAEVKTKASVQQVQSLENNEIDNLTRSVQELKIFQQKGLTLLSVLMFLVPILVTVIINIYFKKV